MIVFNPLFHAPVFNFSKMFNKLFGSIEHKPPFSNLKYKNNIIKSPLWGKIFFINIMLKSFNINICKEFGNLKISLLKILLGPDADLDLKNKMAYEITARDLYHLFLES